MNTNELIERLARDLQPVTPLPQPGRRAALWLLCAVAYAGLIGFAMRRGGVHPYDVRTWLPQLAAIAASFVAVRAAFAAVIPGRAVNGTAALLAAALLWLGALAAASTWQVPATAIAAARHEWVCVGLIVVGGAPLMVALTAMLRRGAPLHPVVTAALAALAVGTVANLAACWSLPHGSNEVTLAWHGGAVVALVLAAVLAARALFRWRRPPASF
jgi:hypothetical protein